MSKLVPYDIPSDIKEIMSLDVQSLEFKDYREKFTSYRSQSMLYIHAFTNMLHFEELSESKRVEKFNLENVELNLHSFEDRIFKIECQVNTLDQYNEFIYKILS